MKPSEIDGQAVIEGIMIRSQSEYAIAMQREDGSVIVKKSNYHRLSDKSKLLGLPFVRGIVHSIEILYLGMKTLLYSYSFVVKQAEREKREWQEWISTGTGRRFTDKKKRIQTPAVRRLRLVLSQAGMVCLLLCTFIFTIGLLVLSPMFLAEYLTGLGASMSKSLLEGILRLLLFFIYLIVMSGGKHIRHMFMYHGAKHKVIHCIENGLPLIIKNVRRQPRKHRHCDTGLLLLVICLSSVCFLFVHTEFLWQGIVVRLLLMPLIVAVSYEMAYFISESESKVAEFLSCPNIWLQELTTREPDDDMLEVTIQAVETVFDWRTFLAQMEQPVSVAKMEKNIGAKELREEREKVKEAEKAKIIGETDGAWRTIQIHKKKSKELIFGEKLAKQMTETERKDNREAVIEEKAEGQKAEKEVEGNKRVEEQKKEKIAETKLAEEIEQVEEEAAVSQESSSLSMRTRERLLYSIHGDEIEYDRYKKNSFHKEQSAAAYEDALMEEQEDLEDDPILKALDRYFGN